MKKLSQPDPFTSDLDDAFLSGLCHERWVAICRAFCKELGLVSDNCQGDLSKWVDFSVRNHTGGDCSALVKCLCNYENSVNYESVKQFARFIQANNVSEGIIFATNSFSENAWLGADDFPVDLIGGRGFLHKLKCLTNEARARVIKVARETVMEYPICPDCGSEMLPHRDKAGRHYYCVDRPHCNGQYTC